MKIFINTTEDWKSIKDAVAFALKYLKKFDIKIKLNKIDLDVSIEDFYEVKNAKSKLQIKEIKSLKAALIKLLGVIKGGDEHDYYGLVVDRKKAKEGFGLYGQHNAGHKIIEVYATKKDKKYFKMKHTAYTLIHELLHALAEFYGVPDTLHEYLSKKNKSLDKYVENLFLLISKK